MVKEKDKARPRILVVDDEEGILDMLNRSLSQVGYETVTTDTGSKALDILKDQRFDTVLTDIKMKGVNGLEVLKRVREIDEDLPVIMITGYASIDSSIEALNIGAFAYIKKPLEMGEVMPVLARAVRMYQIIEENNRVIIELHKLAQENKELLEVVQRQNEELSRFKSKTEGILKRVGK